MGAPGGIVRRAGVTEGMQNRSQQARPLGEAAACARAAARQQEQAMAMATQGNCCTGDGGPDPGASLLFQPRDLYIKGAEV